MGVFLVVVMVVRMVPFLNMRLAEDDSLKWPIVGRGGSRKRYVCQIFYDKWGRGGL